MKFFVSIFKQYKWELLLIYFYMLLTEGFMILQPFVLGKTIDGLLKNDWGWLWVLIGIYLGSALFMYKRMVYDTKVYTKIYNGIVMDFIRKSNTDVSSKIARTDIAHQITDILENYAHYYIATIVTILGSLFFIFNSSWIIGLIVLLCGLPIWIIVRVFYKKITQSTVVGHNHYEQKVNIINRLNMEEINNFFTRRRRLVIYGSTLQGKNWFWINTVRYIFLSISLAVFIKLSNGMSLGDILSMYTYINNFLISLLSIPVGMEAYTRIKDAIKRLTYD